MIKLTTTRAAAKRRYKILVHAIAGHGKTVLCSTTGDHKRTLILSAESGLLSIAGFDIPVLEIKTMKDMYEAYEYLIGPGRDLYDWVCVDSITEIAEQVLLHEKSVNKDPRAAYGNLQDEMNRLLRAFRDLPFNVYMSAKQERTKDEKSGLMLYAPMFPGSKLSQAVPYLFDEVFALRVHEEYDDEGKVVSTTRKLQTGSDMSYTAKDRSGALDMWEEPSLEVIADKISAALGEYEEAGPPQEIKSKDDLLREAEEAALEADSTPDEIVESQEDESNENQAQD